MKNFRVLRKTFCVIIFIFFISSINIYAATPTAVQNLHTTSGHAVNEPNSYSVIKVVWSAPDGYTDETYFCIFNTSATYTFDFDNADMTITGKTASTSKAYENKDNVAIYFHVAAVGYDAEDDEVIGPVSTLGPLRIDNVAPFNVSISAPSTTTDRIINLQIASNGATKMNISNSNYGGGEWEAYSTLKQWELTEGAGLKTIYVQLMDMAENKTSESASVNYLVGTAPVLTSISNKTSKRNVPVNVNFALSDSNGGLITVTINSSNATTVANDNSSFTLTTNNKATFSKSYTIVTSADENYPMTLTVKPANNITGTTTITITAIDSAGLSVTEEFQYKVVFPDLDDDENITINDVKLAFQYFMGLITPETPGKFDAANVSDDGQDEFITIDDVKGVFSIFGGF